MTEDKKEAITESNEVGENNESLKEKKIEIASKNPLIFDSDSNTSHPEKNSNEDDLNDTIDFSTLVSKGKNFFKRKLYRPSFFVSFIFNSFC